MHRPGLIFAAIALLGVGGIHAQESSKSSVDQPPENSLATARKSFESLTKKHPTDERGVLEMPTLAAPEFNLGARTALESPKNKATKSSKNWLVDGVMSAPAGRDRDSSSADLRRSNALATKQSSRLLEEQEITALPNGQEVSTTLDRPASRTRETAKQPPESFNPLASYMNGWISTQDRALLLPPKNQDFSAANPDSTLINFSGAPTASAASPSESAGLTPTALKTPVQDNPYLGSAAFNAPALGSEIAVPVNVPNFAPVIAKPLDSALRGSIIDSPAQAATKVAPRDLAKPDDNAKYFKQLKRF